MKPGGRLIHFWSEHPVPRSAVDWDPDREPTLFADGFGHNMLELYRRLAVAGVDVSIGDDVPEHARLVVFLPSMLNRRDQVRLLSRLMRHSEADVVAIRSDFITGYDLPVRPSLEVMPNQSSVVDSHQAWIPPLPQRGLVVRDPGRGDRLLTLGFKGYVQNLPQVMGTAGWRRELEDRGWAWEPDLPDPSGVTAWHDFSSVDVALCLRGDADRTGWLRKPATKLINAWAAGSIPLVGREPGYMELARHREDAMIVESSGEVLEVLDELRDDPALVRRLHRGVRARSVEFSTQVVLDRWIDALLAPSVPAPTRTTRSVATLGRVGARWALSAARGDRDSPVWTAPSS